MKHVFCSSRHLPVFVGLLSVCLTGCAPTVPATDLSGSINRAIGETAPIELQLVGEPVDVAEPTADLLTLSEVIRRTLVHSPGIQAALYRVRAAESGSRQERLLPNPVLSVILRWPQGGGSPEIEAGLAADVIALLTRTGRINAADSRLRAAAAEALTEVLDTLSAVQGRYAAVQSSDELLTVLEDRGRIVERLLEITRARLRAGEGTRLDVLSLEAQLVELQAELTDRRLERREERLQLARLIGEPSAEVEWRVTQWEPHRGPNLPESQWIALGLKNRPEVLQQRYELQALGADYRLTRFVPIDGGELGAEGERAGGEWAVGPSLAVPVPLFDFGQAKRQKARAALIEARHNLTQTSRQVVEEVRLAYANVAASSENLRRVSDHLIPLAERRLDQAEAQFKAGQTDITGLLLAEEQVRAARSRLVELELRNSEAIIRLHRAVGGPGVVAELAGSGDIGARSDSTPLTTDASN